MSKEKIYAVDDEENIRRLVSYNLEAAGYSVTTFESGEALMKALEKGVPNLFILDLMLPGMDGLEICRRLKSGQATHNIPIIMLTAKAEDFDKVLGLELGADDYLAKPFGVRELTARVKAVLRRLASTSAADEGAGRLSHGDIVVDLDRREVFRKGEIVDLPLKEFEVLKTLMQNKGRVLSRDFLLEKIWGFDYFGETRTVDVHIRYLRQKIEDDDNNPVYIETVRGIGYKFSDKTPQSE